MDPIASIVALYNSLLSNPNNNITEDFDELIENSNSSKEHVNKKENTKNSQTELITVPTILLDYIKSSLGQNIMIPKNRQNAITPELRLFGLVGEKEEKREDNKKIISSKKAKRMLAPNLIRHSLLQLKRTLLNFGHIQTSSKEDTHLITVPSKFVSSIRGGLLQKYQEDYQEYLTLLSNINRVESVRLADSLLDAESNNRRKKAIDDMISALKKEDLLQEENKSVGIRIAS